MNEADDQQWLQERKILILEERIKVVERNEKGESCPSIADSMGVGKTQIQSIIRERESLKNRWEAGEAANRKYAKLRKCAYQDLDSMVWDWFCDARRLPRSTPMSSLDLLWPTVWILSLTQQQV